MAFLCGNLRRKKKLSDSLSPLGLQPSDLRRGGDTSRALKKPLLEVESTCSSDDIQSKRSESASVVTASSAAVPAWGCYWKAQQHNSGVYQRTDERPRPPGGASRPHTQGGASRGRPPGAEEAFWWDTSADVGTPERQDMTSRLFSINTSSSSGGHLSSVREHRDDMISSHSLSPHKLLSSPYNMYQSPPKLRHQKPDVTPEQSPHKTRSQQPSPVKSDSIAATLRFEDLHVHDDFMTLTQGSHERLTHTPNKNQRVRERPNLPIPNKPQTYRRTLLSSPGKLKPSDLILKKPPRPLSAGYRPLFAPRSQESILINSDYELTPEKHKTKVKKQTRPKSMVDKAYDNQVPGPIKLEQLQSYPQNDVTGEGHTGKCQIHRGLGLIYETHKPEDRLPCPGQSQELGHYQAKALQGQQLGQNKDRGHNPQCQGQKLGHYQGVSKEGLPQGKRIPCQGQEAGDPSVILTYDEDDLPLSPRHDVILVSPVMPAPDGDEDHWMEDATLLQQQQQLDPQQQYPRPVTLTPSKLAKKPIGLAQGQLKLSIYVNHGLLTAHVIQGRNFNSKSKKGCNSFVKVSVIPDKGERPSCTTEVIFDTNNPVYDDKFSFEVTEGDQRKRLFVSVWNRAEMKPVEGTLTYPAHGGPRGQGTQPTRPPGTANPDPKLLGCMSFGIKHLVSKKKASACGWYYLLTDDVGRRKHLKVATVIQPSQGVEHIPKVNKALQGMDTHTALLNRGKTGYGFTLTGNSPVTVGRIEPGSSADLAGLQSGDAIIKVNGRNVSRSTTESVARIVKSALQQLLIEYSRTNLVDEDKENRPAYSNVNGVYSNENQHGVYQNRKVRRSSFTVTKETITQTLIREEVMASPFNHTYMTMSPWQQRASSRARKVDSFHSNGSVEESSESEDSLDMEQGRNSSGDLTHNDHELTRAEQERQLAITDLMESEQHYVTRMQTAIAWYCRPLRHGVLSSQKHKMLFQNIEKLVALSEFHLKQLEGHSEIWCDGRNTGCVLDAVGVLYHPKVLFLCEAYEQYASGLNGALQTLDELRTYPEFQSFLCKASCDDRLPEVEEFLQMPIQHLNRLFHLLQETLNMTSPDHHDYQALHTVVQSLSRTLFTFTNPQGQGQRAISKCSLSSSESHASVKSTTSVMSIDSEILEIQSRLLFPSHVEAFKLAQPNRHFIFSSEVMWVENGKTWSRVLLMLFNDVIILTQAEKAGYYLVMDAPIYLNQISAVDFTSQHPSEFQLVSDSATKQQRFTTFRAFSVEQKCTWKALLEQRVNGSRSQTDLFNLGGRNELGISL